MLPQHWPPAEPQAEQRPLAQVPPVAPHMEPGAMHMLP
jgi:hypothetical protein